MSLQTEIQPTSLLTPPAPLMSVRNLQRHFGPGCLECADLTGETTRTSRCAACGTVVAVHDVSFDVGPGEVLGIVGESGSGKSTLLGMLNLDVEPDAGSIDLAGYGQLLGPDAQAAQLQRSAVMMVQQNPLAAGMYPRLTAESNVAERMLATGCRTFDDARARSAELLGELGIQTNRQRDALNTYSGGMAQRVQLARALVHPPRLLLLDEPTTGLDPSVQAGLLETVQQVTDRLEASTIVVSHDLDVVRILASRVLVLHFGRVVEHGIPEQVFDDPQHPYTQLLVASRL